MEALNSEHAAALRHAIELREHASTLLDRDAARGVEFAGMREIVEEIYVSYPGASHLLGQNPTHVPSPALDPGMHFITLLAYEVAGLSQPVRLRDAVRILGNFNSLATSLVRALTGNRSA